MIASQFTKKKIGTLTLGEKIRKIRSERRISISDVSKATGIQAKYLEALEAGSYESLPAAVYVRGFLRSYANYLSIDDEVLLRSYEREKKVQSNMQRTPEKENFISPINFSRFAVTPKAILVSLGLLLSVGGFYYLYHEISVFVSTPRLVILEPLDGSVIQGKTARVRGVTEKDSEVFINEQPILLDDDGRFNQELALQNGANTISVRSKNRFDKEETKTVVVRAEFEEMQTNQTEPAPENSDGQAAGMTVVVRIKDSPVTLSVEVDGLLVFNGAMLAGDTKEFKAVSEIAFTADKGDKALVKINGQDEKPLREQSGQAEKIVFKAADYRDKN